jgi:hypothetical protein
MANLSDILTGEKKQQVVADCCTLIDAEVKDKGGISGLAIKAGYAAVKGVKPGFVQTVVTDLLPEFAKALEPVWADAKKDSKPIAPFFAANTSRVADALLSITDEKAQRAKSAVVKGTYEKLRKSAKKNVEEAVPRLGEMVQKYAP